MRTGIWILLASIAALVFAAVERNRKDPGTGTDSPERIDRPHYLGPDEHECPQCGAKFQSDTMQCPNCGARFTGTREDMTAYDDELEEELDMDDWDEEEK